MTAKLKLIPGSKDIPSFMEDHMTSTKLVMPSDLNPAGNLFGGTMMAWMDKISAMLAYKAARGNVVTASVSEIAFKAPVYKGDQVTLTALLVRLGTSSMTIHVNAEATTIDLSKQSEETRDVASAKFNFVHLDMNGRPAPILR